MAWWLGARATGHGAYRPFPIVILWVGSYVLQATTYVGLLMAHSVVTLGEPRRAQATDVVTLAFVCLGAWVWLRTALGSNRNEALLPSAGRRRTFALGLIAAVFALATLAKATQCGTMACRAEALRAGVGDDVMRVVDSYVRESPAIAQDIGSVQSVGLRPGTRSRIDVWMDYDSELFLEVLGPRGSGTLDLRLSGNSYRDLTNRVGWWHANGRRVPLDDRGGVDTMALRTEATKAQEAALEAARAASDCAAVLAIIARNEDADRSQTAFRFDPRHASPWQAECAEQLGDRRQAANAYAIYSFQLSPAPFHVQPGDTAKVRRAQDYLARAIALEPESPNKRWWDSRMKVLGIQLRFTESPRDQALCLELKQALAEGRVHYTNACQ